MNNINDNELLSMLNDEEENVKNILYKEYGYIIDATINKYKKVIKMFNVDTEELKADASLGFSNAINSFDPNKDASLKTFIIICVNRSITKTIAKYTTPKAKFFRDTLSINYEDNNGYEYIEDTLKASDTYEPLTSITDIENVEELLSNIKKELSNSEYIVFSELINGHDYKYIAQKLGKQPKQIDNTIQRIKLKIKKLINK